MCAGRKVKVGRYPGGILAVASLCGGKSVAGSMNTFLITVKSLDPSDVGWS